MNTSEFVRRVLLRGGRRPTVAGQSGTSRRRGEGYEFAELRAYVSGDDPRRIDWAATARAGSLQSRVVLEEDALILATIVDDSPSMRLGRERRRLSDAQELAALWYGAARSGDRCIRIGSDDVVAPRAFAGPASARICATYEAPTPSLQAAFRNAYATLPAGCALLVVADMHAELDDELLFLLAARHDATFMLARDPWHADFPLRGFIALQDSETGRRQRFFVTRAAALRYCDAVRTAEATIERRLTAAGWRFAFLTFDADADLRAAFAPGRD